MFVNEEVVFVNAIVIVVVDEVYGNHPLFYYWPITCQVLVIIPGILLLGVVSKNLVDQKIRHSRYCHLINEEQVSANVGN